MNNRSVQNWVPDPSTGSSSSQPLVAATCPNCKRMISTRTRFCGKCGEGLALYGVQMEAVHLSSAVVNLNYKASLLDVLSPLQDSSIVMANVHQCINESLHLIQQAGMFGIDVINDYTYKSYFDLIQATLTNTTSKVVQKEQDRRQFYTLLYRSLNETVLLQNLLPRKDSTMQGLAETCLSGLNDLYQYMTSYSIRLDNQADVPILDNIRSALQAIKNIAESKHWRKIAQVVSRALQIVSLIMLLHL